MLPPPWKQRSIVYLLAAAPLFCLRTVGLAQSATPAELLLKVASAKYVPDKEKIEYKLENDGPSAVTAYAIEVSVSVNGKPVTRTGQPFGEIYDLLSIELFAQCRNAPENADDEDARPWPNDVKLPPGVLVQGKTDLRSFHTTNLLDEDMLKGGVPEVKIRVTGIIWADGRIEGRDVEQMQHTRDLWLEAAREERDTLTVLKAQADNENEQQRIVATTAGLKPLMAGYPRQVPTPKDEQARFMHIEDPWVVSRMIDELDKAAYSPNPKARLTFLTEFSECIQREQEELQAPAMAGSLH